MLRRTQALHTASTRPGQCDPLRALGRGLPGAVLMLLLACPTTPDPPRMLPAEVNGWSSAGPVETYDAEGLYEYIDGGAEVYRALNVRAVQARRYEKEDSPEIIADLFDMGTPSDAFGAYHHDLRGGESAGLGQESEYEEGALAFWKGRYFVSIIAEDETPEARRAVMDLGKHVAAAIPEEGAPPDLLRLLPEEGLHPGQVHYFHNHLSLGRYQSIPGGNVLGLGEGTEGILARYRPDPSSPAGAGSYALLIIAYPSAPEAREASRGFLEACLPDAGAASAGRTPGGTWAGAQASGRILIAVLDAPSRAEVEGSIRRVIDRKEE